MLDRISTGVGSASFPAIRTASEKSLAVQTESDDNDWFKNAARQLLGSDPGLALHVLTGISESSGYRYANGSREITGPVFRQLLRSTQGWQWLCACMEGCTDPWWLELCEHKRCAEAYEGARNRD